MITENPDHGEVIIEDNKASDRLQVFFDEMTRKINELEARIEQLEAFHG